MFAMKTPSVTPLLSSLRFPLIVQPKLDGLRAIAIKRQPGRSRAEWFSFYGKPLYHTESLDASLPPGVGVFDGEITWPGHPFSDAYGAMKRSQSPFPEKDELRFHVFDRLTLDEWKHKETERPLRARLQQLAAEKFGPQIRKVPSHTATSAAQFRVWQKGFLEKGFEGAMAKDPEAPYFWKRHPAWQRYKPTKTVDVKITGMHEGAGKWSGALGAFDIRLPSGVTQRVGGGLISEDERRKWWERNLVGKTLEVKYKSETHTGRLREPRIVRLRPDKP